MTVDVALDAPVYLLKGDDDVLLHEAALSLVQQLVGDGDRTLTVDELDATRYERDGDVQIGPLVDAAQTPPFLTDRRVVVGWHAGLFSTADAVAPLVAYLSDPLPTTALVLVWERSPKPGARLGRLPTKLGDAIKQAGGVVVETAAATGRARDGWIDEQVAGAGLRLDAAARNLLSATIGEDAGLLVGLLPTLVGVYGEGARLGADEITPYLPQEGGVKPFELTDAIDAGDVSLSVDRLHRLMAGGGWHPLQVMATLTNHYLRMVALDGARVADEKAAAALLGMKGSTYPAKKALTQSRKLGSDLLADFARLLAQADVDLRGARAWPPELVVEVLVARLASRTNSRTGGGARARAGARR